MSCETSESAGEKAIELDQDNRKMGGRGKQNSHYKKGGVDQLHPAPSRGASTAHESFPPRPI